MKANLLVAVAIFCGIVLTRLHAADSDPQLPNPVAPVVDAIKEALIDKAKRMLVGDRSGISIAQQAGISIYTQTGEAKGWYGDELTQHWKSSYQDGTLVLEDELSGGQTTHSTLKEWNFSMYDYGTAEVLERDSGGSIQQLGNYSSYAGESFYTPPEVDQDNWYVYWGATGTWNATYQLKSSYSNSNGDQRLNTPSTYNVQVTWHLANLSNDQWTGFSETPWDKRRRRLFAMDATQDDVEPNIELLPDDTSMWSSPQAVGSVTRRWDWRLHYTGLAVEPWILEWYVDANIQPSKQ